MPEWLAALPSEAGAAGRDARGVQTARQAGIDLPTDGELYRFDRQSSRHQRDDRVLHPADGRHPHARWAAAITRRSRAMGTMRFRRKPAGVVEGAARRGVAESAGGLRTRGRRGRRAVQVHGHEPVHAGAHAAGPALRRFRGDVDGASPACWPSRCGLALRCLQVDEANIPGNPADGPLAAAAINRVLDAFQGRTRGAPLLRQLRRADDPEGRVAGAARLPELAARGPRGAGDGAPSAGGSGGAARTWTADQARASAWWM